MSAGRVDRLEWERRLWARGIRCVAGMDEAGRGPLAGPVVAAAVILPIRWRETGEVDPEFAGLNDSKQLSPATRETLYDRLVNHPEVRFALGWADPEEIDRLNILRATHRAMQRALAGLQPVPEHVLVDGRPVPGLPVPHSALVRGDARSYSIAAASVLAKVTRDRFMVELDRQYPGYGFAEHKGYPTPRHLEALARLGPCPAHRRSFTPVRTRQMVWHF
ncbi:ribonuclease HII [Limisphaera sp. VF-2]|uniref:ribonuclease HII n=1 Tax=Limisphaera sp. VF-2 TaxID=3400418 RepID=UPI0017779FA9